MVLLVQVKVPTINGAIALSATKLRNELKKYGIVQNFSRVKLWQINHFMKFGKENVDEFTIANINDFSEPGIWLGKILANGVRFAKFAKVFSH